MNRKVFDDSIGWLQKFYQQALSPERLDFYFGKFIDIDDDLFANVVSQDVPKKFNRFPTPSELSDAIIDRRERDYQSVKAVELSTPNPITEMPVRTREAADWKKYILEHFSKPKGKEARELFLQRMAEMHGDYPESGWDEAREDLRQWYGKKGLL